MKQTLAYTEKRLKVLSGVIFLLRAIHELYKNIEK
jgi:hypothetical protein